MCNNNIGFVCLGELSPAVLFLNSNQSRRNLHKKSTEIKQMCYQHGICLKDEVIVSKGPDRSIDREAINMLISLLLSGRYEVVVVEDMSALTDDESDLLEFVTDAGEIGVTFFELSSMQPF